jgi:hypothetical protein
MRDEARRLIEAIHRSSCSCVLATTGGGASAAAMLLAVPGASRTILEVHVPYAEDSFCSFLGKRPEGFCSAPTGIALAETAWARAAYLAPHGQCLGIGCTASLATDRPKRGEHRFFISIAGETAVSSHSLVLEKGTRSRFEEEDLLDAVLLNALAESLGLSDRLPLGLSAQETLQTSTVERGRLAKFMRDPAAVLCSGIDGRLSDSTPKPTVLIAGSFNPVHEAHWALARIATEHCGASAVFELSLANVDKPSLQLAEVLQRLAQFHGRGPIWLTHAPTFVEKARRFPNCTFVVGMDTAERIAAVRYYGDDEERCRRAAEELRSSGCRFLVAARADAAGCLRGLDDIELPECFGQLCTGIPKDQFHIALSSTELRKQAAARHASHED